MPQPPAHKPLGTPLIELQSVDSTNNYARSLLQESFLTDRQGQALHGTAIFAHEQVAGKGQRGKTWTTEKSANIILSIIVHPRTLSAGFNDPLTGTFQFTACVAVTLHEFFAKYAGPQPTSIKWPNDLYWQDRKAGGILIESRVGSRESGIAIGNPSWAESEGVGNGESIPDSNQDGIGIANRNWSIIGIGININQTSFLPGIRNPVSLKQITGKIFPVIELANEICQLLDKKFIQFNREGFNGIYSYYQEHLYKRDEMVRLKKDNKVFEATIKGVSLTGQLIVHHGIEEVFDFGKVEWIM